MNIFDDLVANTAREHAEAIKRIRIQASDRAKLNGLDQVKAANDAEQLWFAGCSHETIITEVGGQHRRRA